MSVHPRVCGEHGTAAFDPTQAARSIPACAGNTSGVPQGSPQLLRSIPACAGNTDITSSIFALWVGPSPRVRGTRIKRGLLKAQFSGPSPRVRGTLKPHGRVAWPSGPSPRVRGTPLKVPRRNCYVQRSIPACAGNTRWRIFCRLIATGPSPRVRGTRLWGVWEPSTAPVHPRVCGEHQEHRWC